MPKLFFLVLRLSSFVLLAACAAVPLGATPTARPAPTSPSDNPTAGAARRSTQVAATQIQQALGTRVAGATQRAAATLTAQAADRATLVAATQQAIAAAATGQAVLAAKGAWPQKLVEGFADNHLGWPLGLTADHSLSVTSSIDSPRYHWVTRVTNGNSYFNLVPAQGPVFGTFYAQVTLRFGAGNDDGESAYGLAFRRVKDDYGYFGITKSGRSRILEVHGSGIYQEDESDLSAFDASAPARLAVIAVGPDFDFLVNDQLVGQMNADLDSGEIGLGIDALTHAGEAQVDFSDFQANAP